MLRFPIRDLFWLTVLAAISVAWWIDKNRMHEQAKALDSARVRLAEDRVRMQAEFDDKIEIVDRLQREASDRLLSRNQRFGR